MPGTPPTSVLLSTTSWTDVVEEVAGQIGPSDELLVICDRESDPVADRIAGQDAGARGSVRLVVAGEPEGCSGKANAVAAGMEAAERDRIVWTDDDFHHPECWLDRLHADYDRQGPTTEVPFFVGRDPLAVLLEPQYALGGTLGVYLGRIAWAGAVIFERDDLPDEGAFLRDLRRTVSDDGLLSDRIDVTPVKRVRRVPIGGSLRTSIERHVRFVQIVRRHALAGIVLNGVVATVVTVVGILFPLPAFLILSAILTAVYVSFDVRRWTVLLAYPSTLLSAPLMAYALARRTFVWGGRRYRWRGKFDVEILE
ncbi:MAG: glycosyltransferase [Haloferacaceae archaeon]